jgi:hypothetical protein
MNTKGFCREDVGDDSWKSKREDKASEKKHGDYLEESVRSRTELDKK